MCTFWSHNLFFGTHQPAQEVGFVLPLSVGPSLGKEDPFRLDDADRTSIEQARGAVQNYFQTPGLPKRFCSFPDVFSYETLTGSSLGLAVAFSVCASIFASSISCSCIGNG